MRLILDSTNHIINVRGIECRMWNGNTSNGTPVQVFIAAVGVDKLNKKAIQDFQQELLYLPDPSIVEDQLPYDSLHL